MACSFTSRHCYIKFKKFHTVNIICYLTGEQNEWKSDLLCPLLFPIALMLKILMGTLLRLFVLWSIHLYNNTSVCKYLWNFICKLLDCNLGTAVNSDCCLDTLLWSLSSSKLNSSSLPSESFFSTSNDSERVMHNKYMIHRQLLILLSNKSLICYLVNIVTLKIQRLNQWLSLPVSLIWNTQNAMYCCYPWASHLWLQDIYINYD